jgi:hypothetical protein
MSMTNEQIQALKEAAEKAKIDDWGYDYDEFNELVKPDSILALLAERDADKALIAEQREHIAELERKNEAMTAVALAMRDDMREARSLTDNSIKGQMMNREYIENILELARKYDYKSDDIHAQNLAAACPPVVIEAMARALLETMEQAPDGRYVEYSSAMGFANQQISTHSVTIKKLQNAHKAQIIQLLAAFEEVLRISDRQHDAWDRAKAAIAAAKGDM